MSTRISKILPLFIVTFVLSTVLALIVAPLNISGPGVEGMDCGPYGTCAAPANQRSEWFGIITLLNGDIKIGRPDFGGTDIVTTEKAIQQVVGYSALVGLMLSILVTYAYIRQRRTPQKTT